MSECEICGKEMPMLIRAKIEESVLSVCSKCIEFGEKTEQLQEETVKKPVLPNSEALKETILIDHYGFLIKNAREKMKLSRLEFAAKIKEKENIIKRVEASELKPDDKLLEKIEKFLNLNLKEKDIQKPQKKDVKKAELTLGDVVQIK